MRPRPISRLAAAGAAFVLTLLACPALAQDPDPRDVPYPAWKDRPPPPYPQPPVVDPLVRENWLAECRHRLSGHDGRRNRADSERAMDQCEDYFDSYYAYYRAYRGPWPTYGYPAYGYPSSCCGPAAMPMMMAPAMQMPRAEPKCTETVEYEYVDQPAPPRPRPAPEKRIKIVPDKRIPVK